jgi:hypothetical protein
MTNQADRTPTCVLVAIDIAKQWNAALIEYPDGKRVAGTVLSALSRPKS